MADSEATVLFSHAACLDHDTSPGHPESSDRLRAILVALDEAEFAGLRREAAPLADESLLLLAHSQSHIDRVKSGVPAEGYAAIDPDTIVSPGSWNAALRAVGGVAAAIDLVMTGQARNGFCAVRPPGHHATRDESMGFCLFNNVAIGARHAVTRHHVQRVAIIDFDVHHGNGTQDIVDGDASLFFASTHQHGAYPGTGANRERGRLGNILNLPLPAGSGGEQFRPVFADQLLPRLRSFAPELILISAGFDAHDSDPLALMRLNEDDFSWATQQICSLAEQCCEARVVSSLEGGYDLPALARSVAAHLRALMAKIAVG